MTKHPAEIEAVRGFIANLQTSGTDAPSIEEMRSSYASAGEVIPVAEGASVEEVQLGGVDGVKLTPDTVETGRVLLYFHGGGYVIGSPHTHKGMVSQIAKAMRATAYSMDYRMAPEAPFPAAVEDGLASYKGLLDAGVMAEKIVISGDSAGGGLTVATAVKIREAGLPMPAALAPISPWANLANTGATYQTKADSDPMITQESIDRMAAAYLSGRPATDPLASPVNADLSGFPPMLIQVGSEEVLLSDSTLLAARAGEARVPVTLEIWPDMIHVFHYFFPMLSDARAAIARMGRWVDELIG